ncbi:MAG: protein translocase subunit SecF [Coriobacteriia bacterium]|nr:protein translocase subunit SecF [Coriobacteriia bacterium]
MPNINFLGNRKIMFAISGVLLAVSIGSLLVVGLTFGVEFLGGTAISVSNTGDVTSAQMTQAFKDAGVDAPNVQTTEVRGVNGFIIRTPVTDPTESASQVTEVAKELSIPLGTFEVTTIGPGWGENITNRALMALGISLAAILLYISVRFEYKMSITSVVAVVHDILITLGIYALLGYEVTPNTIAALLTILGYSLYDTIVVFHRIKDNAQHLQKQSFMQMANTSLNEVIVRSMNTTITSLIPVLAMLFFGGEALRDFALALSIGLLVGAYSSIGVASPLYALWKESEPRYAALRKKYADA